MNWNISDFITILDLMILANHKQELDLLCEIRGDIKDIKTKGAEGAEIRRLCAFRAIQNIGNLLDKSNNLTVGEGILLEKIATYLNAI